MNRKTATKYEQEGELAATKKWINFRKTEQNTKAHIVKEAAANFRLKTRHDCLAHWRKFGIYESSESTVCQTPDSTMDDERLLHCPKLGTDQQVLKNTIKLSWNVRAKMR